MYTLDKGNQYSYSFIPPACFVLRNYHKSDHVLQPTLPHILQNTPFSRHCPTSTHPPSLLIKLLEQLNRLSTPAQASNILPVTIRALSIFTCLLSLTSRGADGTSCVGGGGGDCESLRSGRHRGKRGHVQLPHHHHHHHRVNESAQWFFFLYLEPPTHTHAHTNTRTPGIFPFITFSSRAVKGWTYGLMFFSWWCHRKKSR